MMRDRTDVAEGAVGQRNGIGTRGRLTRLAAALAEGAETTESFRTTSGPVGAVRVVSQQL